MDYPVKTIDQDWRRLIPSKFPTIDVYERLGSDGLRAVAIKLEELTNPRLAAKARLINGPAQLETASAQLQNWNHAPFAYTNPEGSRFLNPAYRAMDVADNVRAALAWAVQRREAFMSRTQEPAAGLDMRLLTTRIRGEFVDLRSLPDDLDQKERWGIGQVYYEKAVAGLLFNRPGIPGGGPFLSVFDPSTLVSKSIQATHYRFRWDGQTVCVIYDFDTGKEITRDELFRDKKAAA